jgi:hypothetical protein
MNLGICPRRIPDEKSDARIYLEQNAGRPYWASDLSDGLPLGCVNHYLSTVDGGIEHGKK